LNLTIKHRSLGNIAQKDVNKQNEVVLFAYMYLKPNAKDTIKVNLDKQKLRKRRLHTNINWDS
jgi:hypothetical protein